MCVCVCVCDGEGEDSDLLLKFFQRRGGFRVQGDLLPWYVHPSVWTKVSSFDIGLFQSGLPFLCHHQVPSASVYVCVCVCEREKERESLCTLDGASSH